MHKTFQRYTVFGHGLVGVDRFAIGTINTPPVPSLVLPSTSLNVSNIGLAVAFGGGVDMKLSSNISLRVGQVDYLYTQHNFNFIVKTLDTHQNNVRASAGVVFVFGGEKQASSTLPQPTRTPRGVTPIPLLGLSVVARSSNNGSEIVDVIPGSIGGQAGLQVGDVLNQVDGKLVRTTTELSSELSSKARGSNVRIGFLRRGYWQTETTVSLK
jgi:hypothetical protein